MKAQKIGLTREDFTNIVNNGGKITFTPLKRNKLKCNQVPGLTRLSSKQAETLRKQFGAMRRDIAHGPPQPMRITSSSRQHNTFSQEEYLPKAYLDFQNDVECPKCGDWHFGRRRGQKIRCNNYRCSVTFIVV